MGPRVRGDDSVGKAGAYGPKNAAPPPQGSDGRGGRGGAAPPPGRRG